MTVDAGEDMEKEEHSSIAGGIASWYNHSGDQFPGSSRSLNVVLLEDPPIPLLAYTQKVFQLVIWTHVPLCS